MINRSRQALPPKQAFSISRVLQRIGRAVEFYPKAALFELAEDGFRSPFEQLVACIISIRTRDETTLPTARRLFQRARTSEAMSRLTADEIDRQIAASTFHEPKAQQIHAIACRVMQEFGGDLPCDRDVLLSFHGVGIKCAHLVLGIACEQPFISVAIHVHRVTNRWGYVAANTPEQTTAVLEKKAAETLLDRDQSASRTFWQTYLHRRTAEMLHLPSACHVPPGGGNGASLQHGDGKHRIGRSVWTTYFSHVTAWPPQERTTGLADLGPMGKIVVGHREGSNRCSWPTAFRCRMAGCR